MHPPSLNRNPITFYFSEQQLVDCDPYDSDCNGGWYTNAWNYLRNVAGRSARQSLYSYTAKVNYKTIDVSLFYNQQYFQVLIYLSTLNEFSECYLQIHLIHDRSQDCIIR
jgi:hypothetical protein